MSRRNRRDYWQKIDWPKYLATLEAEYATHSRLYLGYGSNLNVLQMQARCPTSLPVGKFRLRNHKLVFSSVLTVEKCKGLSVPAALWRVAPQDIASLDSYEGYPHLYDKQTCRAWVGGKLETAFYYTLNEPYAVEPPCISYYETCAEGYAEFGLDLSVLDAAVAEAEVAAREAEGTIEQCGSCMEHQTRGTMEYTRSFGYLCPSCAKVLGYDWSYDYDRPTYDYDDTTGSSHRISDDYNLMRELDWTRDESRDVWDGTNLTL